jgi:hypothetical protein
VIRVAFFCLLLALPGISAADTVADSEAEMEIAYLLNFVATSGCTFIRNGDEHDAADAADHLRLKYKRGKSYAGSAEQFIDRLATESSWTGKPYTVTCDGGSQTSAEWLYGALAQYRQQASTI